MSKVSTAAGTTRAESIRSTTLQGHIGVQTRIPSLSLLPPSLTLSPALSSQAPRFAQLYIAHALDGDLQAEYAAVVEAGDTVVTRDGSILSQRSWDGCTRNLLSVSRLCVHCGYELCPHCYHTLMENPDAFPPERKLATPRAEMTMTTADPLACQLLGTDVYSTRSPLAFATTTQIAADDLGYPCDSANFAQQAYRVTALREAPNIQQFVGDLTGLNKIPARARATGSKPETDPYDTLEVADPSQVQEVMDKVMSLGQADRSRCLKPVVFRTDSKQKR
ncbi:hypothetical protein A4X13_0g7167 [Tilletia indica]|uniref:Uncharacterized protein n=1 Tax=Tilletia indica TaxID=43049 RepID=A0A177TFW9_9BASI|nr:hypothetical protein A4X13_0g7167 [Tilletia indica]